MRKEDNLKKDIKKKEKKGETVLLGERDEEGKLKTPHTKYGIPSNIKYVMGAIWKYKRIVLLCMAVGSITQPCMTYIWGYFSKVIIDIVQTAQETGDPSLKPLVRAVVLIIITDIVLRVVNTITFNRNWSGYTHTRFKLISERIEKVLSMNYEVLEQPHILDMAQKGQQATGGNLNGVEGLMHNMEYLSRDIITLLVSTSMIVVLDWHLILVLIVIGMVNYLSFRRAILYDKEHVWDEMPPYWRRQNYMERCTQDFDYAKDIRLFDMKNWLLSKQHETNEIWFAKYKKGRDAWLLHSSIAMVTGMVQGVLMYFVLIKSALAEVNPLTIGNFTFYISLCGAFSSALNNFLNRFSNIERNSMEVDDFRTLLDFKDDDLGSMKVSSLLGQQGKDCLPVREHLTNMYDFGNGTTYPVIESGEYHFEFRNVSYKYEGAENYAIRNLTLSLKWGERLAVVGLNGAGKTTFIKLLLRLYKPTEGEILLNGININEFERDEYFSLFSPVFQNVELFSFSMAENVAMRDRDNTDGKRAEEALAKSGLGEKLDSLPNGVDTQLLKIIYDDGIDLSGGEKQKLGLARALYKNAPVIVLDEPTAALDALAEYELYRNFDSLVGSKTAIYISHRLSSTRFCDHVAMFAEGKLVEYGTHEELLKKGGEYAKMFEVQAQYYDK